MPEANTAAPSGVAPGNGQDTAGAAVGRTSRGSTQSRPAGLRLVNPSSRVKLHSTTFFLTATALWVSSAIFCVLLLLKLKGTWVDTSWWAVFSPFWVGHALHVFIVTWSLCSEKERMMQQLGPPPPNSASLALHAQYTSLRAIAARSHLVDNTIALLDTLALLIVKVQFAQLLNTGQFQDVSLRVVFAPIWAVWVVSLVLVCTKYKRERVIGSQRDLLYIFLLMVAFKVDNQTSISWRIVFLIPWLWLTGVLMLACVVMVSLGCAAGARGWRRMKEQLMPMGFLLLLLSTGVPHFAFCVNLVDRLEGNTAITYDAILVPAAVGWAAMWVAAALLAKGLRTRERVRAALLASGAVWAAQEQLLRRLQPNLDREAEQLRVDGMSEEELVALAQQKMQAKGATKPTTLLRVGPQLYRLPDATNHYPTTAATTGDGATAVVPDATNHYVPAEGAGRAADSVTVTVAAAGQDAGEKLDGSPAGGSDSRHVTIKLQPQLAGGSAAGESTAGQISMAAEGAAGQQHAPRCSCSALDVQGAQQHGGSCEEAGGDEEPQAARQAAPEHSQSAAHTPIQGAATSQLAAGSTPPAVARHSVSRASVARTSASRAQGSDEERTPGAQALLPRLLGAGDGLAALLGFETGETHDVMAPSQAQQAPVGGGGGDDSDDSMCVICFDAAATCVLLPCGHGGLCRRCAHLLICRPPNVCATCRQAIDQVVELDGHAPVGKEAKVKQ